MLDIERYAPPAPHGREREVVLVVSGELDAATAPRLREALHALVGTGLQRVTVDAAAVRFVDSAGLATLIGGRRRLAAGGTTLVVRAPSTAVTRVLACTGLRSVFGVGARPRATA